MVLLSSDHGDMLGSQGRRLKRKPWEESIHIPGVLRYPKRVLAGRKSDAFFTHVDFAPTLLGLAGVPVPPNMQGTDLSGIVTGARIQAPDSAFFQIFGPYKGDATEDAWRGVRTHRHKYARFENKPWVLYDLEKDPYEMRNMVDDPGSQALRKELEQKLAAWMRRTGDSWDYDWKAPVEDDGRLYTHGTFYSVDEYLKWEKTH